jgi:hypothetical protein
VCNSTVRCSKRECLNNINNQPKKHHNLPTSRKLNINQPKNSHNRPARERESLPPLKNERTRDREMRAGGDGTGEEGQLAGKRESERERERERVRRMGREKITRTV